MVIPGRGWWLALALAVLARAAPGETNATSADALWFPVGEELVYNIYWGVIPVGYSKVTTGWVEEDGRRLIAIRFRTRTNKVLKRIYPVDDVIESIIEPATFLPVRFVKNLKEGRYRCHEITEFDHAAGVMRWKSKLNGKVKEFPIKPDTRDLVSFMYYARKMHFEPGQEQAFQVMADEKIYDVLVRVLSREKVQTADEREVRSLKMEPEALFEGLFVRKGRIWMWVAEDEPRVVTRLEAKVPVASVKLLLAEVGRAGDDVPDSGKGE